MADEAPISDVLSPPTTQAPAADPVATSAGLLAEMQRERKARQAAEARLAELEPIAKAHEGLTASHTELIGQLRAVNAGRIDRLPDTHKAVIAALPASSTEADIARAIDALSGIVAPPSPGGVPPVQYPAGVQSPANAAAPDELTPAERSWVETARPDLAAVAPATVRKMFNAFAKGAKRP